MYLHRLMLLLAALVAATPALAQSDALRILNRIRSGNVQVPAAPNTQPAVYSEKPIELAAMPLAMKKDAGQQKTFTLFPNRVFVAGYNVGGLRQAKTTGTASGGILNNNPGASSTMEMVAFGIDQVLLTRVANAAYADLVWQLKQAGFEVVSIEAARVAAGFDKLKLDGESYDISVPADRGSMHGIVVGPTPTGVRGNYPLAKLEIGAFGAPLLSSALQAMVVMPNLLFDFPRARSSKSVGYTATASVDLQFAINPGYSKMCVTASQRSAFLEGDATLALNGTAASDASFGTVTEVSESDNSGEQNLGAALGVGVRAKSTKTTGFSVNQARYESLALAAAKGWNTAFVTQLRAQQQMSK